LLPRRLDGHELPPDLDQHLVHRRIQFGPSALAVGNGLVGQRR
jgi:hypothetical protein